MNPKTLLALIVATIVASVVAAVTLRSREASVRATSDSSKLFPELMPRINDAAVLAVERKDGGYELRKAGEIWTVAEKGGYPADVSPIAKTLIALAQMTTVEPKTSDPARYGQLGVQDVGAEGEDSTKLTVQDASGGVLASLIVGKAHEGKQGQGTDQVYVRKPGEAQSWLVKGSLDLKENAVDWLQKEILKVPRDRVRSVEVTHPDGEVLRVGREQPTEADFTLHDIPEGKELSYPSVAGSMANALEWLNFEDVVPAEEVDFEQEPGAVCRFETFDGLIVTVRTKDQDGKSYARFEAAYQKPAEPAEAPAEEPAPAEGETPPKDAGKKSPEEVQQEASELQARLAPWTFVIPAYNRATFAKKKSEMLKDPAPPSALGEDPAGEGASIQDELPVTPPADGHAGHDHETPGGETPPPAPAPEPDKDEGADTPPQ